MRTNGGAHEAAQLSADRQKQIEALTAERDSANTVVGTVAITVGYPHCALDGETLPQMMERVWPKLLAERDLLSVCLNQAEAERDALKVEVAKAWGEAGEHLAAQAAAEVERDALKARLGEFTSIIQSQNAERNDLCASLEKAEAEVGRLNGVIAGLMAVAHFEGATHPAIAALAQPAPEVQP